MVLSVQAKGDRFGTNAGSFMPSVLFIMLISSFPWNFGTVSQSKDCPSLFTPVELPHRPLTGLETACLLAYTMSAKVFKLWWGAEY